MRLQGTVPTGLQQARQSTSPSSLKAAESGSASATRKACCPLCQTLSTAGSHVTQVRPQARSSHNRLGLPVLGCHWRVTLPPPCSSDFDLLVFVSDESRECQSEALQKGHLRAFNLLGSRKGHSAAQMWVSLGTSGLHEAADSPKVPERIHALLLLLSVVPAAQQRLLWQQAGQPHSLACW